MTPAVKAALLGGYKPPPSFFAPLQTSLLPTVSAAAPTFARATVGTVIDFQGLVKTCLANEARFVGARRVQNLVLAGGTTSTNNAWGANSSMTQVSNTATAPDGTASALSFTATAGLGRYYATGLNAAVLSGDTVVSSVWLKGSGTINLVMYDNVSAAYYGAQITLSGTWTRYSISKTLSTSAITDFRFGVILDAQAGLNGGVAPTTTAFQVWGAQLERVTGQSNQNPSEYVSKGVLAAPYYGAGVDGVRYFNYLNGNTVSGNVVTAGMGALISNANSSYADKSGPFGYLAEPSRANVLLQSASLTTTPWATHSSGGPAVPTLTANAAIAPDGTNTATQVVQPAVSAANTDSQIYQIFTAAASVYTFSVWLKGAVGGEQIYLSAVNQAGSPFYNSNVITLTTSWQLYTWVTPTLAVHTFSYGIGCDLRGGTASAISACTYYAWGAQAEVGLFPSTYIPTTTSTFTRSADALTYPTANVGVNKMTGAVYAEVTMQTSLTNSSGLLNQYLFDFASNQLMAHWYQSYLQFGVVGNVTFNAWTAVNANTIYKLAGVWKNNVANSFLNTGMPAAPVAIATPSIGSALAIGNFGGSTGYSWGGTIRNFKVWPAALSNAALAAITAQ